MASRLPSSSAHLIKAVKPIYSTDRKEAKRRVLNLYRAWIRYGDRLPYEYDIPKDTKECKVAIKEQFVKYKNVKDLRTIDLLVAQGQQDLIEVKHIWSQKHHIMTRLFSGEYTKPEMPDDFMSAFIMGKQDG